jgi:hypothetical protein
MRRFVPALAAMALVCGCAASAPPPQPVPPKAAIVALASPPAQLAPKPTTNHIVHKDWDITVPADWTVSDEDETGVKAVRAADKANHVLPALVEVASQDVDPTIDAKQNAVMLSVMCVAAASQDNEDNIDGVRRGFIVYEGRIGSLTQVGFKNGSFTGCIGLLDETAHRSYLIVAVAPQDDGHLMATISKTFHLHNPAPPLSKDDDDDSTPPAPDPKAVPKHTSLSL